MGKTKREIHRGRILKALQQSGIPHFSELPVEATHIADAILDAIEDVPKKKHETKKKTSDIAEVIGEYCDLWRAKWKAQKSPVIRARQAKILGDLVRECGKSRVSAILRGFFQMPDAMIHRQRHPLELLDRNLNQVLDYIQSGAYTSRREEIKADDQVTAQMQLDRISKL